MEYFHLSQDETHRNPVIFDEDRLPEELKRALSWKRKADLISGDALVKDKSYNIIVKNNGGKFYYSDLIETPFLLVSDGLKKIFSSYEQGLQWNCAILSDRANKEQRVYWFCTLEKIDCLDERAEFYPDHSLKRLVLDKNKIDGKTIFQVSGIREQRIIADINVTESILKRPFTGIHVEKVVVGEE